jgi:UDP-N-acetylglucosamine 2-epimerase
MASIFRKTIPFIHGGRSVELGWNRVVPPVSGEAVAREVGAGLEFRPGKEANPYGDGHGAEKIISILLSAC